MKSRVFFASAKHIHLFKKPQNPSESEKFLTAATTNNHMANPFDIKLGDILRIVFAVIVVMVIYKSLVFLIGMAKAIIIVIAIYIIYKILKAII